MSPSTTIMRSSFRPCNGLRATRSALLRNCSTPIHQRTANSLVASQAPAAPIPPNRRLCCRPFHTSPSRPKRRDAPPASPPPTNFGELDVLGSTPVPPTSVDVCMYDGFGLNSGVTIEGGDGALLVNGEAFAWRPWEAKGGFELVNGKGQFELPREAFGLFDMLWPRPDLLVIGVGKQNLPLSPQTRKHISEMGMKVEVLDTRNAAAQFNLLATERGVSEVAAALIPIGWTEGSGVIP